MFVHHAIYLPALGREQELRPALAAHLPRGIPATASSRVHGLLRAELHRLFDRGYIDVSSDLRLLVSRRLRDKFDNGRIYQDMAGSAINVPRERGARPSLEALRWHAENVFR